MEPWPTEHSPLPIRLYSYTIVKKISSGMLFVTKKIFPVAWFGFLAVFFFMVVFAGGRGKAALPPVPFLLVPTLMAIFGFFLMKKLVWDLADEVYDGGDFLLIKKGSEEERVELSNIMNVSFSMLVNPPRVTLRLVTPGIFGQEIAFSPVTGFRLNPFARNPMVDDLVMRVDQARRAR
jgi:hypothetical protein